MTGNDHELPRRAAAFRQLIAAFIEERRAAKSKGQDDGDATPAAAKYEYHTWLADAARRVSQIQAVTHVLKATHPDARGSSLYTPPHTLPRQDDVGTHSLNDSFASDIVGNAAALDVYKFLKLELEGNSLLNWLSQNDEDLLTALHPEPNTAMEWANAFKSLIRPAEALSSHTMAKQLYWCVSGEPNDDEGYHLLQPLFASSLAHAVHQEINDARFGEANKAARQAKNAKIAHSQVYHQYQDLTVRQLGGSKPQNISQLNSERGGVNYLLPSLPPRWNKNKPVSFLHLESAMQRFRFFEGVDSLIIQLQTLLQSSPGQVMETRQKREALERAFGQALARFGLTTRLSHEPGWTRHSSCHLPLCEQVWLDPERAELPVRADLEKADLDFQQALEWKDWPDEVASRFANWLNARLIEAGLPVGDTEQKHWAKQAIIDAEWPARLRKQPLDRRNVQEVPNG